MAHNIETRKSAPTKTNPSVSELASLALAKLATGGNRLTRTSRGEEARLLCEALLHRDESRYQNLIAKLIAEGLDSEDLLDRVIPDAARQLGEEWLTDDRSFADVTIGSSRLQQTVRNIGARRERSGSNVPTGHRALLILPEAEQHSLGTFIIANQLRRQGVWVQMVFDCDTESLCPVIASQHCSMIGLSLGSQHSLDRAPKLTSRIRSLDSQVPIFLGGTVLTDTPGDYAETIGADFVAQSAREALDFCALTAPQGATLSRQLFDA